MAEEGELEQKVVQSMKEGYSEEQIVQAMSNLGFEENRIRNVIAEAEQDLETSNPGNNSPGQENNSDNNSGQDPTSRDPVQQQPQQNQQERSPQQEMSQTEENSDSKSPALAAALGIFGFIGYLYVGRKKLALLNFVTMNYFSLGFIIAPIHCYLIANKEQ